MTEPPSTIHFVAPARPSPRDGDLTPGERELLDALNRAIAGRPTLDAAMGLVFDTLSRTHPCDRIGLAFAEEDGRRIVSRWARALYEPVLLGRDYAEDLSGSSLTSVLANRTTRVITDLEAYAREHPRSASTRLLLQEGVHSSLTCPLVVEDRAIGVVFLSSRQPSAFTERHVALWQAAAERLSQAVEKTWRIEQLEAANRAYLEVLAFVSHELKNPVASMITDARLLADGYLGELKARQKEKLERLAGKGRYLLDLVRDYLDLARVEGGELRLDARPLDLVTDVLGPAIDLVEPQLRERGQVLEQAIPASPGPVEGDPGLLTIVLVNLLGNASKYGHEGGRIRATLDLDGGMARLAVWNEGPGFRPEERPRLFRRFSRLASPGRKGTGIGLYTCWRIAQLHGGRMEAASQPGAWAEFAIAIPVTRDPQIPRPPATVHPSP